MASKLKRGAPEKQSTGSSPKRRAIGEEGPSKIGGKEELGVVQGSSNEVKGEGSFEKVLDQVEGKEDLQNGYEHPLLNPLVLEKVFQYTGTLEEVKRNRLVCRTWMNACEPEWTTLTKTLTLFRNEELPEEAGIPSDEAMMTLQQLREMCNGARSPLEKVVLYRKFKFQNWSFDADLLQAWNSLNELITTTDRWFWNRIAPSLIKRLTLENCWFPVRFVPFEECFLKSLPNLECLIVIHCTTTPDILKSIAIAAERDWFEPMEERFRRANLGYKHQNLKYVHLNVHQQEVQLLQPVSLIPFFKMVSSLEGIRLEGVDPGVDVGVEASLLRLLLRQMINYFHNRGLRKLDLLDFSTRTYKRSVFGDDIFQFNNLEEFHYDVGYGPEAEQEVVLIQRNMPVLKKLYLYRAPLSQSLSREIGTYFLYNRRMETLTELHLWGNLCSSLEFLNAVPNLRVLKWVTSCYEEKFHGQRVMSALEESEELRIYPLILKDLINASDDVITLEHLTTFELDCGPISATSWNRLGEWMPNLKNLKGIVSRVEHLGIIREQWKHLESMEFAHGSKLPGGKLLKELAKFGGSLKAFQWKGCACTRKLFGKRVVNGLQKTEIKLGSQLPGKCTFPWNANLEGDQANLCKHAVFEETLMSKAANAIECFQEKQMNLLRDFNNFV